MQKKKKTKRELENKIKAIVYILNDFERRLQNLEDATGVDRQGEINFIGSKTTEDGGDSSNTNINNTNPNGEGNHNK